MNMKTTMKTSMSSRSLEDHVVIDINESSEPEDHLSRSVEEDEISGKHRKSECCSNKISFETCNSPCERCRKSVQ